MTNYNERRFGINEPDIDIMCDNLELKEHQISEVKRLYFKALQNNLTQGRELGLSIGALAYYVVKNYGGELSMKTIADKLNLNEKLLFKALRHLKREMMLKY
jgi:transcription initiation factor TFIIIB Brf1 subunit/transcription initiation factor TFIIB